LPPTAFPDDTLLARYAFSQALSRSTALSALEESLDNYLSSVALLPHSLEKTGKPGLRRKALIKKLGELMKFRQGLNLNRENFSDTPDFYWGEPELEGMTELVTIRTGTDVDQIPLKGFFNSLSDALEVKARTTSVNEKITYAAEVRIFCLCIIEF
jgi:required for meiotic nuclear division protein 1